MLLGILGIEPMRRWLELRRSRRNLPMEVMLLRLTDRCGVQWIISTNDIIYSHN